MSFLNSLVLVIQFNNLNVHISDYWNNTFLFLKYSYILLYKLFIKFNFKNF